MAVERALLSVFDKRGIVEFASKLAALKIEILSTGGTAKLLREEGVPVRDVSEFTGWPEMLGGRVKTLHPKVHGGLLYRRHHGEDQQQAKEHGIAPIDLVVVNLYPFEETAAKAYLPAEEPVENIDIGGPTMLRSAAKNFESVAVISDPADYDRVAAELEANGDTSMALRLELARKVFAATSRYDGLITMNLERLSLNGNKLEVQPKPVLLERYHLALQRKQELRYGEIRTRPARSTSPRDVRLRDWPPRSNCRGRSFPITITWTWKRRAAPWRNSAPAAVIIKHNNPCGAAEQKTLLDAYSKAFACDPVSAFGGVLAFNHIVDALTAEAVAKLFVECIVAPGFADRAQEIFAAKKNLRLLVLPQGGLEQDQKLQLKRILGGVLVQQPDLGSLKGVELRVVTKRAPTEVEMKDLQFAWKVCKHVKSNAIVFAKDGATLGVGAGQMSRVDSAKIAIAKAQMSLQGTVVASDAFFPFPDGVEESAKAGATAVIQPGGSVKDADVIATADRLGLAMVFTGMRHFLH